MSDIVICECGNESWGHLELKVADLHRNFHRVDNPEINFSIRAKGLADLSNEPFLFYEWQKVQYAYVVSNDNLFQAPFELRINDRIINTSGKKGNSHVLSGQFSFDDGVGETVIELRDSANTLIFELSTEVFPQKMDYKSDYAAMMAEISEIVHNLAYDSLKDVFRRSRTRLAGHATQHEWWNIMDALFGSLLQDLKVIQRQPKHEIINSEKVLPVEKIRSASKKNVDWLRKNTQYAGKNGNGLRILPGKYYSHALSAKKQVSYDTYENRFVTWAIKNTIQQLKEYKKHIEGLVGSDYLPLLNRMKMYQGRLQALLHEAPFNEAGRFEKTAHFSTSLTRGAGYRDFFHIYLLLSRGLELVNNDIFKIEQKNISLLYEYWCFLKLVQLLKEQNTATIDYQDLVKVSASKLYVGLRKGESSEITFSKKGSGESTTIYYNKEFTVKKKKTFTYDQRPDYSIEFKKKGFEKPFWYLLDAKYRFEESLQKDHYNAPSGTIGQLHQYRDAIFHSKPGNDAVRRATKNLGGIILYPYPLSEAGFKENAFYKSIEEVNVGALPFLPGKTSLVSEFLNHLINKASPEEHYERFIEMDHSEYVQYRNKWKESITISVLPKEHQEERSKFISDKRVYHVPFVKDLDSRLYMTQQLLICKSGTREAGLYDVKSWTFSTDKDLRDMGTTWPHRAEKYITFNLYKKAEAITTPDMIAPWKFRYTTREGLRLYRENPRANKDYFYFTTPDAARLYEELKRAGVKPEIRWIDDESDPSLLEFFCGEGCSIRSSEKFLDLHYQLNGEYNKRPLKEVVNIAEKFKGAGANK